MGLLTLADFRTDVQSALGNRGLADATLDRYINFGYLDLTGAVEFEALSNDEDIATVGSQNYIVAPTNTLNIKLVRDSTNDNILSWIPKTEYYRRLQATEGEPTHWTRHGDNILLHPIPDQVYSMKVVTTEPPTELTSGASPTVLPDTWDPAVFQLSVHHGLLALAQEQRSAAWLSIAISYIKSRITEHDYHSVGEGQGASIPRGMEALMGRLQAMQGES